MNFSHLLVGLAPRTVGSSKHEVAALQSDLYLYNVYIHVCMYLHVHVALECLLLCTL